MFPIALIPGRHEKLLMAFRDDVSHSPDADFTPRIKALAAEFRKLEKECEKRLVDVLFLSLYGMDVKSLRRDLAKLSVVGKIEAAPSQRIALLSCLYGVLALYVKEYFPETYAMIENISKGEESRLALDTWGSSELPE